MSLFRKAAKRDQSERLVIETLRQLGWSVLQVSVKDGPDLFAAKLVNWVPRCVAIECKTGKRKLKPGQAEFAKVWQGEYVVCRSVEDVLKLNQGA
jgi:Holliday junction resolvase